METQLKEWSYKEFRDTLTDSRITNIYLDNLELIAEAIPGNKGGESLYLKMEFWFSKVVGALAAMEAINNKPTIRIINFTKIYLATFSNKDSLTSKKEYILEKIKNDSEQLKDLLKKVYQK